jgi:hypothetical protein
MKTPVLSWLSLTLSFPHQVLMIKFILFVFSRNSIGLILGLCILSKCPSSTQVLPFVLFCGLWEVFGLLQFFVHTKWFRLPFKPWLGWMVTCAAKSPEGQQEDSRSRGRCGLLTCPLTPAKCWWSLQALRETEIGRSAGSMGSRPTWATQLEPILKQNSTCGPDWISEDRPSSPAPSLPFVPNLAVSFGQFDLWPSTPILLPHSSCHNYDPPPHVLLGQCLTKPISCTST